MESTLKVAAIQFDCTPAPVVERLARASALIVQSVREGAQLVVLPELFNTGYEYHARNYTLAEPLGGKTVTWMKAQAAEHNIHLAGTMLLRDDADIYNAAVLVAPDGQVWRYNKHYVPFWERAYSRGGEQITIAETSLGKLGMLICWDQYHPDLWDAYAGKVDAMVVMSCPGDIASGDLIFPDGYRDTFMTMAASQPAANPPAPSPTESEQPDHPHAAWMHVPVIESSATGTVRTKLPLIAGYLAMSPLADRVSQADEMLLECGFPAATKIVNAEGRIVAQGTNTGDGIVMAEIALADTRQKPTTAQPDLHIAPEMYELSDMTVPGFMIPLYEEGMRSLRGG